ncbi:hypothetical protein [Maribellus sp. YY47]|uniref:hypothetical protein n=1 Tax=Maribellus sp. YY47 TaxID=2929486 RepID=UPI0020005BDE|nr:hypothetical protein [Maribellus sp. YY47]MCK3683340.1 hypothetical protein [Maribellus sp. YY47]
MIKKLLFLVLFAFTATVVWAQNMLEWSEDHPLTVKDFEAPAPNNGQMQTVSGSFSVSYEFGGLSLISTRNLNQYVHANFQKNASYIDRADAATTNRLLAYQQLIFNVYELQARNLRKKFYDERGKLLTKGPGLLYQEVAAEHSVLLGKVESETFHGASMDEIKRWNEWVLQELEKLNEFCKDCKPSKKKNRNQ